MYTQRAQHTLILVPGSRPGPSGFLYVNDMPKVATAIGHEGLRPDVISYSSGALTEHFSEASSCASRLQDAFFTVQHSPRIERLSGQVGQWDFLAQFDVATYDTRYRQERKPGTVLLLAGSAEIGRLCGRDAHGGINVIESNENNWSDFLNTTRPGRRYSVPMQWTYGAPGARRT